MARRRWDPSLSAAENARLHLPALAQKYFETGRAVIEAGPSPATLHKFRLATKRFRYTLEMFSKYYGPRLDEFLERLRKIQDLLGSVNDDATTRTLMEGRLPGARRIRFERFLEARTRESVSAFHAFWKQTFDGPGEEERWVRHLAASPGAQRDE